MSWGNFDLYAVFESNFILIASACLRTRDGKGCSFGAVGQKLVDRGGDKEVAVAFYASGARCVCLTKADDRLISQVTAAVGFKGFGTWVY